MRHILITGLSLIATTTFAHPGHGVVSAEHSFSHYLSSGAHFGTWLVVLAAIATLLAFVYRKRTRTMHPRSIR